MRRLAHWCFRHRRRVLLLWVIGLVLLGAASSAVGSGYRSDFTLPNVESKKGIDILDDEFGGQGAGQVGNIVFQDEQGVEDPAVREVMEPFLAEVAELEGRAVGRQPLRAG